jgi:hypothetical protein
MRIMADSGYAVRSAAHVEFKAVAAVFERDIKCFEGIFRGVDPRSPVPEEQRCFLV